MKHILILEIETDDRIGPEETKGKVVMGVMGLFDGDDLLDIDATDLETFMARQANLAKGKKNG